MVGVISLGSHYCIDVSIFHRLRSTITMAASMPCDAILSLTARVCALTSSSRSVKLARHRIAHLLPLTLNSCLIRILAYRLLHALQD